MLFPLLSQQAGFRLIGAKITVASSAVTKDINGDEFTAATSSGAGLFSLTMRQASSRNIAAFGTIESSSTSFDGGAVTFTHSLTSKSNVAGMLAANSGTATDGTAHILIVASNKTGDAIVNKNPVVGCKRQGGVLMFGAFSSAGAVTWGKGDFTCTNTATGKYTIAFRRQIFGQAPIIIVRPATDAGIYGHRIDTVTTTGFNITIASAAGSDTSAPFYILVYGFSAKDSYAGADAPLSCTSRKGLMELYQATRGSPITFGSQLATASTGTGTFTMTRLYPSRRLGFGFGGATHGSAVSFIPQQRQTDSASQNTFFTSNHATASLADPAQVEMLVFGFDDPAEY